RHAETHRPGGTPGNPAAFGQPGAPGDVGEGQAGLAGSGGVAAGAGDPMNERRLRTEDFDYDLPEELIAQEPVTPRDAGRLLVVDKRTGAWQHKMVRDLPTLLLAGDVLVRNDTRVLPARLIGVKAPTGGRV